MPQAKLNELRNMDEEKIESKLIEMRVELAQLRAASERGSVKKEEGKIRPMRRNIARFLTIINDRREQPE